jgi:hypothetical protein
MLDKALVEQKLAYLIEHLAKNYRQYIMLLNDYLRSASC